MKSLLTALCLTFLLASSANAYVINFDDGERPGTGWLQTPRYMIDDYMLSTNVSFTAPEQDNPWYLGSTALHIALSGATAYLTTISGNTFTLNSIDLAYLPDYGTGASVTFTAYDAWNHSIGSQTFSPVVDTWTTFSFSSLFEDILYVSWVQEAPFHQFDNIVLNEASPVPEPSTSALLGIALLGLLVLRHRFMHN